MDNPILTLEEREAINAGRWFSTLSPTLKHDILRCAYVKRFKDGALICARGEAPEDWIACAKGAVRVSSTSIPIMLCVRESAWGERLPFSSKSTLAGGLT